MINFFNKNKKQDEAKDYHDQVVLMVHVYLRGLCTGKSLRSEILEVKITEYDDRGFQFDVLTPNVKDLIGIGGKTIKELSKETQLEFGFNVRLNAVKWSGY